MSIASTYCAVAGRAIGAAEAAPLADRHVDVLLVVAAETQLRHSAGYDVYLAELQLNGAHGVAARRGQAAVAQHTASFRCGLTGNKISRALIRELPKQW